MPLTDPPLAFGRADEGGDAAARFRENYAGIITDYEVRSRYYKDGSLFVMGCASPQGFRGVSAAFVQLAAPTLIWVADWTAQSSGERPPVPNPLLFLGRVELRTVGTSSGASWILLDEHYELAQIELEGDGVTPIFRLSGTYVYGCLNPNDVTVRDVRFPKSPYVEDGYTRDYSEALLLQGIIN